MPHADRESGLSTARSRHFRGIGRSDTQKVEAAGHGCPGGTLISGAAVGVPQVKALVYINSFAPDPGQSVGALLDTTPPTKLAAALSPPDSAGFLFVDPAVEGLLFASRTTPGTAVLVQ